MASKKSDIAQYLAGFDGMVTFEVIADIQRRFGPISDSYLKKLLRESNLPLDPLVEGVRQENFESLERTLVALSNLYADGARAETRKLVITGKDHAKFAARREEQEQKREMILWMMTWLENPELFPRWLELRKRALY